MIDFVFENNFQYAQKLKSLTEIISHYHIGILAYKTLINKHFLLHSSV